MKKLEFFKNVYYLKRINLEKLSLKHVNDIHEYSIDERFYRYFEYQKFLKKNQTKKYLLKKLKDAKKNNAFWWSIKLKNNDKVIGTICIQNINTFRRSCEIGYGINPKFWNKGFFTEALKYLLKVVLRKNRFLRCQSITSKKNYASIRGLTKCGFKKEGIMRNFYRNNKQKKNFDAMILAKTIK